MEMYFKIAGAVFLILSGWGFGLYKSFQLKSKSDFLFSLCLKFDELQNKIRMGAGETEKIILEVFRGFSELKRDKGLFYYEGKSLDNKDKMLLNEFFSNLGKGDRREECEKIRVYRELFYERCTFYKNEYAQKSKIWQTFGACAGISAVLMMI